MNGYFPYGFFIQKYRKGAWTVRDNESSQHCSALTYAEINTTKCDGKKIALPYAPFV